MKRWKLGQISFPTSLTFGERRAYVQGHLTAGGECGAHSDSVSLEDLDRGDEETEDSETAPSVWSIKLRMFTAPEATAPEPRLEAEALRGHRLLLSAPVVTAPSLGRIPPCLLVAGTRVEII